MIVEPPNDCEGYCDLMEENCGDVYGDRDTCLSTCALFPDDGEPNDADGNTLQCRIYHAGVAADDSALHCPHASASGGDMCGSYCEVYCDLVETTCTEDNALYADREECMSTCAEIPTDGESGATAGDSIQCRIYHGGVPAAADPMLHCPHAGSDGAMMCAQLPVEHEEPDSLEMPVRLEFNRFNVAEGNFTVDPVGDNDYFIFTLDAPTDLAIGISNPDGSECSDDTLVALHPFGEADALVTNDDFPGSPEVCSLLAAGSNPEMMQVPAGDHVIRVWTRNGVPSGPLAVTVVKLDAIAEGEICGEDPIQVCAPDAYCAAPAVEEGEEPAAAVCTAHVCGDGVVAPTEACDDGNEDAGDGCEACEIVAIPAGNACDPASDYACAEGNYCGENVDAGEEDPAFICTADVCGDEIVSGAETCDDGNAVDGDGCDSCQIVPIAEGQPCDPNSEIYACADNTYCGQPAQKGDPVNVCIAHACGDDLLGPSEECEDAEEDLCDACVVQIDLPRAEEPNDRENAFQLEFDENQQAEALFQLNPAGDEDWFVFTLPVQANLSIGTRSYTGTGCEGDTIVDFYAIDGETAIATDDDAPFSTGFSPCSLIHPDDQAGAIQVPAGDYLVRVRPYVGFGTPEAAAMNILNVTYTVVGIGDECDDDTAPCPSNAFCQAGEGEEDPSICAAFVCGDGEVGGDEECDDGNEDDTDGCTTECLFAPLPLDAACEPGVTVCVEGAYCGENADAGEEDPAFICTAHVCGDGVLAFGEACDDGNDIETDGCTSECRVVDVEIAGPDGTVEISSALTETDRQWNRPGAGCEIGNRPGRFYKTYTVVNNTGMDMFIDVTASWGDFDGYLHVYNPPFNPESADNCIVGDDDFGGVSGSQITDIEIDAGQRLVIVASGYGADVTGEFGLSIYTQIPPECGNGIVEINEECDDENVEDGDGCSSMCLIAPIPEGNACDPESGIYLCDEGLFCAEGEAEGEYACAAIVCGDGQVAGDEACDDGNDSDVDGCTTACAIAPIPEGEACDPNSDAFVCEEGLYCSIVEGDFICNLNPCGNGQLDLGGETPETCDDGNAEAGDGCSDTCQLEEDEPMRIAGPGGSVLAAGELAEGGPQWARLSANCSDDGGPSDHYYAVVQLINETRYDQSITLTAAWDFDGYLHAFQGDFDPESIDNCIVGDDDFGGAPGSQITDLRINDGETITVVLSSYNPDVTGNFELTVETQIGACGDGMLAMGEQCDDGNGEDGDGCSSLCVAEEANAIQLAPQGESVYFGGAFSEEDPTWDRRGADCTGSARPGRYVDTYRIVNNTDEAQRIDVLGRWADFDGYIHLFQDPADLADAETCIVGDDDYGRFGYPNRDGSLIEEFIIQPGETLTVVASTFGEAITGDYVVEVRTYPAPVCGDGVVEYLEECEPSDGEGIDLCDPVSCTLVTNEAAEPDAIDAGYPVEFDANNQFAIAAQINPAGERDWFAFTLPMEADVYIDTYSATNSNSCAGDTYGRIYSAADLENAITFDDDDGPSTCPYLGADRDAALMRMAAGDYVFAFSELGDNGTTDFNVVRIWYVPYVANGEACGEGMANCAEGVCEIAEGDVMGTCMPEQPEAMAPNADGQLIITEIMKNPALTDADAEWFEVYNNTEMPLDLTNITFMEAGDNPEMHVIAEMVVVAPGEYAVLARLNDDAFNGGLGAVYGYGDDFQLGNGSDEIVLVNAADPENPIELDRVEFTDATFPDDTGRSMQLVGVPGDVDNSDGANWCSSDSLYYTDGDAISDYGTPGAMSGDCFVFIP